jgi:hypothetical protein
MSRRFQFSLRALLVLMAGVAFACAIWANLPPSVRFAIGGGAVSLLVWLLDWTLLLPPYGDPFKQPGPRYVIKWRRGGKDTSE